MVSAPIMVPWENSVEKELRAIALTGAISVADPKSVREWLRWASGKAEATKRNKIDTAQRQLEWAPAEQPKAAEIAPSAVSDTVP